MLNNNTIIFVNSTESTNLKYSLLNKLNVKTYDY
jgi:hypothetical protein